MSDPDLDPKVERDHPPREVVRHRLLGVMAGRFDRRLTLVEAPAGYGKSTLLRQATDEAAAASLGLDVSVRARHPGVSAAVVLIEALQRLVAGAAPGTDPMKALCDAIWSASPDQVCVIIDDVHLLGGASATMLATLLDGMPGNGHLVLCGRSLPTLTVARDTPGSSQDGDIVRLDVSAMAFDVDERAAFRRLRGTGNDRRDHLDRTGWPALIELGAADGDIERFLRDEVISSLDELQRDALRTLAVHRSIDTSLVHEVTSFTGTLAELVAGVPLTAVTTDQAASDQVIIHDLVRDALLHDVADDDLDTARRRVSTALAARRQWSDAIALARAAGDDRGLLTIAHLLAAELHIGMPDGTWLSTLDEISDALAGTVAADVFGALATATRDQPRGLPLMLAASARARDEGDADLEALCVSRLAEAAFGLGRSPMLRQLAARLDELAAGGCAAAQRVQFRPHLWLQTIDGSGTVVQLDEEHDQGSRDDVISRLVAVDRVRALAHNGYVRRALDEADQAPSLPGELMRIQAGGFLATQRWFLGELDAEGLAETHRLIDRAELRDAAHLFVRAAATTAIMAASAGDGRRAIELIDRAEQRLHLVAEGAFARHVAAQARAVVAVLDGDDDRAAALLRDALPPAGLGALPPFIWNLTSATHHVLLPEVRAFIETAPTGPDHGLRLQLGAALVALRDRGDASPAAALPWSQLHRLRPWLMEPHLAELAVAAVDIDPASAASTAFGQFRHDPRRDLARLEGNRFDGLPAPLGAVLQALPRRPRQLLSIRVLGPTVLTRDGVVVGDEAWTRRRRVRDLLLLLVAHRSITRSSVLEMMWPDKPARTAAANLRFTLNQLHSVLEPDRDQGEAPWYVITDHERLHLRDSDLVVIDVDEFVSAVAAGEGFDRAGDPELALVSFRNACELHRGDFLAGASDPDWGYYEAIRLRGSFVRAAVRASALALVQGEIDEAEHLAHRAVTAEQFHEGAVRALTAALIGQRRLGAAREALAKLISELDGVGITPEPATRQLARRLGIT